MSQFKTLLALAAVTGLIGCDSGRNPSPAAVVDTLGLMELKGEFDTSFNSTGVVNSIPSNLGIYKEHLLVNLPGNKVAIGDIDPSGSKNHRFNLDGSQDVTSWGVLESATLVDLAMPNAIRGASLVQFDGKVITSYLDYVNTDELVFFRYNLDGSLDTTFGVGGRKDLAGFQATSEVSRMIQQIDGKILIAARVETAPSVFSAVVLRLNMDGSLDDTFDTDGIAIAVANPNISITSMDLDRLSGEIYIGGHDPGTSEFLIQRISKLGVADLTYGTAGLHTAAGTFSIFGSCDLAFDHFLKKVIYECGAMDFGSVNLRRLNYDGQLDTDFGTAGVAKIEIVPGAALMTNMYTSTRIRAHLDGNYYILGATVTGMMMMMQQNIETTMTRITPAGVLDPTFAGGAGILKSEIATHSNIMMTSFEFLRDGRIALGGYAVTYTPMMMPGGPGMPSTPMPGMYSPSYTSAIAIIK